MDFLDALSVLSAKTSRIWNEKLLAKIQMKSKHVHYVKRRDRFLRKAAQH
jgi:hypothetical protein